MPLLYATGNPGKLKAMRTYLEPLGLALMGLCDLPQPPPEAPEDGRDPLENARAKAFFYHERLGCPLFACDSGLFIQGVLPNEQPGVHVRVRNGHRMTDEEMIAYYGDLAHRHGGRVTARYHNAICLIDGAGKRHESADDALAWPAFDLVDKPHAHRQKGFPLDALSVDPKCGLYYYDMPSRSLDVHDGVCRAFQDFILHALRGT